MTREDGEHLSALASGLHSLAKGAGRQFTAGSVRQTMIEFDDGFLFVVTAAAGTCLAVFAEGGADIGQVAYEMARLVRRVGEHLATSPRAATPGQKWR
jgi:predicted regulator of Ras-like GTPase activity (Roadblock/LC7/MglB family)